LRGRGETRIAQAHQQGQNTGPPFTSRPVLQLSTSNPDSRKSQRPQLLKLPIGRHENITAEAVHPGAQTDAPQHVRHGGGPDAQPGLTFISSRKPSGSKNG